jgi:hypothetical protein
MAATLKATLPRAPGCTLHRAGAGARAPPPPAARLSRLLARAERSKAQESFDLLEAFFFGKALAEVANERLGTAAADLLAAVGVAQAELPRALEAIQEEVAARARREIDEASGGAGGALPGGASSSSGGGAIAARPAAPDAAEAADELRAEVAAARAALRQLRQKPVP